MGFDYGTAAVLGLLIGLGLGLLSAHYAYFSGATDGFGYCMEPDHPGYQKAGRYLRKYLRHRWPEKLNAVEAAKQGGAK